MKLTPTSNIFNIIKSVLNGEYIGANAVDAIKNYGYGSVNN